MAVSSQPHRPMPLSDSSAETNKKNSLKQRPTVGVGFGIHTFAHSIEQRSPQRSSSAAFAGLDCFIDYDGGSSIECVGKKNKLSGVFHTRLAPLHGVCRMHCIKSALAQW